MTVAVAELMERKVRTVQSEATVAEAIAELADAHISGMPVVDGAGRMIGVLSTNDLLTDEANCGACGTVCARRWNDDSHVGEPVAHVREADVAVMFDVHLAAVSHAFDVRVMRDEREASLRTARGCEA